MTNIYDIAGAGGGGCFRKGTLVQRENGLTTAIELLNEGDEILAFDENGAIHKAKVTKLHYHEDPQPIIRVKFWRGEVSITPNHWVLNQYGNFVEMGRLTTHDALVDGMGHLRPIIGVELIGYEPVWNLTVEPHHTFIANGIRVHNGGHRDTFPAVAGAGGGGGKGGGGGHTPKEDPDTLESRAMVGILDVIGEGRIGGLVNGAQSIFLDDTPLQNEDGTYNFKNVSWAARNGTQTQSVMDGFDAIHTPHTHNVQVKKDLPTTFTVSNSNVDSVRVVVSFPGLTKQDTDDGDLHGTSVQYRFSVSKDGGPYSNVLATSSWTSDNPTGSAWSVDSGMDVASVVGVAGEVTGMSASIKLDASLGNCKAKVQPQYWDGASWINFEEVIALATTTKTEKSSTPSYDGWDGVYYSEVTTIAESKPVSVTRRGTEKIRFKVLSYSINGGTVHKNVGCSAVKGVAIKALKQISTITVTGKTSSKYQRSHVITLPKPASSWTIKMERLTNDSDSAALRNETWLDSYVEVIKSQLNYPNTALIGINIDSAQFSRIPSRSYLVNGLMIKVPSNYDPETRLYNLNGSGDPVVDGSGNPVAQIWDGTFVTAVSDNPAWILYDILTNRRYGLGEFISSSQIDKAKLYTIGQYCDATVPDGFGGYEPRFTINTQIASQKDAYKLICDITSVFRGMAYWDGSLVGITNDAPKDPSMVYGAANVIDGLFTYTGSARKDRHSVVLVTWNDPEANYKQQVEYVENSDLIAKYGVRSIETVAFGCTSRGQARRCGLWILYTEQYESNIIQFEVGIDSALVVPGDVIKINDPTRSGKRMAGRLVSSTTTSAVLDSAVTLSSANATLSVRMPDGTFIDRTVTQAAGTHTTLTWTSPLPELPLDNAIFIVSESSLVPMLARVISIGESASKKGHYAISALEYNPSKYAAIENGKLIRSRKTSLLSTVPAKVAGLTVSDSIYRTGSGIGTMLNISWDDSQVGLKGWKVRVRRTKANGSSDNWIDYNNVAQASLSIKNVTDGDTYSVQVYAINVLNKLSATPAVADHLVLGKSVPPKVVTRFGVSPSGSNLKFAWDANPEVDIRGYEIRNVDSGWGDNDDAKIVYRGPANTFLLPKNSPDATAVEYFVRAIDTSGNYSTVSASTLHTYVRPTMSAAHITTSVSDTSTTNAHVRINWADSVSDFGIDYYHGTLTLPGGGTRVYKGKVSEWTTPLNWIGSATFELYAVDKHGIKSETATTGIESMLPNAPESCVKTPLSSGALKLDWADAIKTTLPIAGYEIRTTNSGWGTPGFVFRGASSSYVDNTLAVGTNTWYIKAFDTERRYSNLALTVTYDCPLPSLADVLNITFEDTATTSAVVKFDWSNATSPFTIDHYHVVLDLPSPLATKVVNLKASEWTTSANWVGTINVTVTAVDTLGHSSTPVTRTVTKNLPNAPTTIDQYPLGNKQVKFDWDTPAKTTLPIAGYEIRATDSGWGTSGYLFRGAATAWTATATSTATPYVCFIKTFDTDGKYSAAATQITHDWVLPPNLASVTVTRSKGTIVMRANPVGALPKDFSNYEFRIGKVSGSATSGNDTPDAVTATGDIWNDPDVDVVTSVDRYGRIDLKNFPTPRFSTSGVTYRVACRMMDTSGNYSAASVLGSIVVKSIT